MADEAPPRRREPSGGSGRRGVPFRVLFVCTGNTCRSPLAESLARRGVEAAGWRHVEVRSAGVAAVAGERASKGSLRAAARHGLDLSGHRSAAVTPELVAWADLILAMSPGHVNAVSELPGGSGKVALLGDFATHREGDAGGGVSIPDPIGGDDRMYEDAFLRLEEYVGQALGRIAPLVSP